MKIRPVIVTVATLAAGAAGVLGAPTSADAAPSAPASATTAATAQRTPAGYSTEAFKASNRQRHVHDKRRLKGGACLTRYAQAQAIAMAQANSMYHQSLAPIQAACDVGWVGENVAFGFTSGRAAVNSGWMHSAGHRENLLSKHYRRMGIGAAQSADGTWYVSQVMGRKN